MEERSLRIYDSEKTFFSRITNTISKLFIPTKIGINGMLISIKRNNILKAYENLHSAKDQDKKEALSVNCLNCIIIPIKARFVSYQGKLMVWDSWDRAWLVSSCRELQLGLQWITSHISHVKAQLSTWKEKKRCSVIGLCFCASTCEVLEQGMLQVHVTLVSVELWR